MPPLANGCLRLGGGSALLRDIVRRASAYVAVRGVLLRVDNGALRVRIVAARPMTKPMQLLARTWSAELGANAHDPCWDIGVLPDAPSDAGPWQWIFWRE